MASNIIRRGAIGAGIAALAAPVPSRAQRQDRRVLRFVPQAALSNPDPIASVASVSVNPSCPPTPQIASEAGAAGLSVRVGMSLFDAGAMNALGHCLEPLHRPGRNAIITPHAGEMAKLLGVSRDAVEAEPLRFAREATSRFHCVSVLKSWQTYVTAPDGGEWVFDGGLLARELPGEIPAIMASLEGAD